MVFQHFELFPHMSISQNLAIAQVKVLGRSNDEAQQKGMKLLERVGLKEQAAKFPGQLSGGQQQRVAIARALVNEPAILLADEPTGNLDSRTSVEVMEILQKLNDERGLTIVLVTHEHDISNFCKRAVVFRDGKIRKDEPIMNRAIAREVLQSLPAVEEDV
jgi:ABC-type lipoprotein export system ATPase subunit